MDEPLVVAPFQPATGVFVRRAILSKRNSLIRVINTNDTPVVISTTISNCPPLSDYFIYKSSVSSDNASKNAELLKIIQPIIPEHISDKLIPLCIKYSDIFHVESDILSKNNFYEQKLTLHDPMPVYIKNYRIPHAQKAEIASNVQKLLKNKLIEPSCSPYNSPVLLVPKKDPDNHKAWRMCIDYRALNKKLIADTYPLGRIDTILDSLGRTKFFTVVDLQSGFHQIPLEKASRPITSFSTEQGSFQWKVVPFGLNVSPNSFARMMAMAFSGLKPSQAFLYMDDIIILGVTEDHHLNNLRDVFETCRRTNLKINAKKCQFFKNEVIYLGHRCTASGVLLQNQKLTVMQNFPVPRNKDETKRFVAFANYYRKFIPKFAEWARVLNQLTRKNINFLYTNECQTSFESLKKALIKIPVLAYPDFDQPFIITVDASNYAVGAVLSQMIDGHDRPISYAFKQFQKAELNKHITEKELLAIHWAIKYFRPYVYLTHFIVKSDHRPLVYLFSMADPSSKLTRIRLDLAEYNFTIEYIKGKDNVCADALSRITIEELKIISNSSKNILLATAKAKNNIQVNAEKTQETQIESMQVLESFKHKLDVPRLELTFNLAKNTLNNINCVIINKKRARKYKKAFQISKTPAEELSPETFFVSLQKAASKDDINELELRSNSEIFAIWPMPQFQ